MPEALYIDLSPLIPGVFLIILLLRLSQHRKNHFLYNFALLSLLFREFQLLLLIFLPNSRSHEILDKCCLLLQGLLTLGLVSIVRVRMPLKIEEDEYYSFQDDMTTIKCFLNGERRQAIVFLIWSGAFFVITFLSFTRFELVSEAAWGIFASVTYFMGASILNNLDRVNLDKDISDQVDLILLLYGLLGVVSFFITGGNYSYPEIMTFLRLGSYFFEAWACNFYAVMLPNFEVEVGDHVEAKEHHGESTCEPEFDQEVVSEHEMDIEMGEMEAKGTSVQILDECAEA